MKRLLILMLALCLLSGLIAAHAEPDAHAPIAQGVALAVDLDGDGAEETVCWDMLPCKYDKCLTVTVTGADGATVTYDTAILGEGAVYVIDLDGDGASEILMTGDVMSDDYYTWCVQYRGGRLFEVLFPDGNRGENTDGYYKQGYGIITRLTDDVVELTGSQDVLGTWMASRVVRLDSPGRFEFADNFMWERAADNFDDDLWEYRALTVKAPIAYVGTHGHDSGTLNPGDRLLVYATDKQSEALFVTPDDVTGILSISRNDEQGWGWLVDGVPEEACFEQVRYAD